MRLQNTSTALAAGTPTTGSGKPSLLKLPDDPLEHSVSASARVAPTPDSVITRAIAQTNVIILRLDEVLPIVSSHN